MEQTSDRVVPNVRAAIVSLNVGLPKHLGTEGSTDDKPWHSGIFKQPVAEALWLDPLNLTGDAQADLVAHGGPDKAVCVYTAAHYPDWQAELARPDFVYGAFGENFTISDLTENDVCIGDTFKVGGATVQISQPRQPCWKLARKWGIKDLTARVQHSRRTGWYFRVIEAGAVSPGDVLVLTARPHDGWTITRANAIMDERHSTDEAEAFATECTALSLAWRSYLIDRAAKNRQRHADELDHMG
ncbi:MAG: MOSC domain-containing protein [Chloroflexi bacterium]|nr:MOSC domain-containing protein [Chloroflexota bacterium]